MDRVEGWIARTTLAENHDPPHEFTVLESLGASSDAIFDQGAQDGSRFVEAIAGHKADGIQNTNNLSGISICPVVAMASTRTI